MKQIESSNLIGVISDTHDQIAELIKSVNFFNQMQVKLVVHCGDWISPFTLKHYTRLQAPLYGVFGNNDGDKFRHIQYAEKVGLEVRLEDQLLTFSVSDRRIAVYHGDYWQIVDALIKCGDYDVVFHGHDHKPRVEIFDKVLSLNPGTLVNYTNESIQGASIGLYDTDLHEGRIVALSDLSL